MVQYLNTSLCGAQGVAAKNDASLEGIPGVLIAGLIVKSLPLSVLRWMVVGVVIYAATMMLRSAMKRPDRAGPLEMEPVPAL